MSHVISPHCQRRKALAEAERRAYLPASASLRRTALAEAATGMEPTTQAPQHRRRLAEEASDDSNISCLGEADGDRGRHRQRQGLPEVERGGARASPGSIAGRTPVSRGACCYGRLAILPAQLQPAGHLLSLSQPARSLSFSLSLLQPAGPPVSLSISAV